MVIATFNRVSDLGMGESGKEVKCPRCKSKNVVRQWLIDMAKAKEYKVIYGECWDCGKEIKVNIHDEPETPYVYELRRTRQLLKL